MPNTPKKRSYTNGDTGMWIRPGSTLKGTNNGKDRVGSSTNSRYLELADIALGLKKAETKKKKPALRMRAPGKV
jgi:hypothetical protein